MCPESDVGVNTSTLRAPQSSGGGEDPVCDCGVVPLHLRGRLRGVCVAGAVISWSAARWP